MYNRNVYEKDLKDKENYKDMEIRASTLDFMLCSNYIGPNNDDDLFYYTPMFDIYISHIYRFKKEDDINANTNTNTNTDTN